MSGRLWESGFGPLGGLLLGRLLAGRTREVGVMRASGRGQLVDGQVLIVAL